MPTPTPKLFFVFGFVESLLYYFAREDLFSYTDEEVGSQCSILGLYQGEADALVEAYAVVAGGYFSYYSFVFKFYGVAVTGNGSVEDFYSYQFLLNAQFFLSNQGFSAYEFGFVQFAEHSQAGFYGADFGAQFVSVQGHSGFEAEGVTAA